jgi:hypothetical protein
VILNALQAKRTDSDGRKKAVRDKFPRRFLFVSKQNAIFASIAKSNIALVLVLVCTSSTQFPK